MSLSDSQLMELATFYRDNKQTLSSSLNNSVTNKVKESLWLTITQKLNYQGVVIDSHKLRKVSTLIARGSLN